MTPDNELWTKLNLCDKVVDFAIDIDERNARDIALHLWKYYPQQSRWLFAALYQTQHTRPLPAHMLRQPPHDPEEAYK